VALNTIKPNPSEKKYKKIIAQFLVLSVTLALKGCHFAKH
jgi:hypothetical protein